MSKTARRRIVRERAAAGKKIPDGVEFVVVMGTATGRGDSIISKTAQWPSELQKQGVPVVEVKLVHFLAVRSRTGARAVVEAIRTPQPRWSAERVEQARKALFD